MKTAKSLIGRMALAFLLAVIAAGFLTPVTEAAASVAVWNVIPRFVWALGADQSGRYAFTFGEGVHEFRFDPVDVRKMSYLEFDIYLPDPDVIRKWRTGDTEFEITSSGACDRNEYAWSGYELWNEAARNGLKPAAGWNHVRLNLPEKSGADLSRINYIRWYWNADAAGRAVPGCEVANLKFTFPGGVDPPGSHPEPFIPDTVFDTEDVPVALIDVTRAPYYADPSGKKDATQAIRDALADAALHGGGTVWMPAGTYRVTGQIQLPPYVTLRGDWADPAFVSGYGTLIALNIPEEDKRDTGTFLLGGCSGVYGLTVYYPDQSPENVKAYPFTFYTDGRTQDGYLMPSVLNCTVLNGYRGIGATTQDVSDPEETGHENMYVLNFRGTFLECGAECFNESDFGFWDDVKIGKKYWLDAARAGILPPVDERRLTRYTQKHAAGLILGDLEWVTLSNISVDNCAAGIHTVGGKRDGVEFQGLLYGVTTEKCGTGILVDALYIDNGMVLANSSIAGGVRNTTKTVVRMFNVRGSKKGRMREDHDYSLDLPVPEADYGYPKPKAVLYTASLDTSGRTDVSAGLQALLDEAGTTGGVVYLPGGVYRMDAPVDVPAGVELRGTSPVPCRDLEYGHVCNGATLLSYYLGGGPEDRALITLSGKGAGISGLRINYPENRIHRTRFDRDFFGTSYAVRGAAPEVYIVNSYIIGPAYGVDFTGCDRHFVKNIAACCYKLTLKMGGKGGRVCNCFQNPGMYFISSTPCVTLPQGNAHIYYEDLARNHGDYLVLDNADGELVYNIAMFGAHDAVTNIDSTDSTVINVGTDYIKGVQTVMRGGSLTVINAMRWSGTSFRHDSGLLRIYNRFEHGYSSHLNGDTVEETYVLSK